MQFNPFRYRTVEEIETQNRKGPSFFSLVFHTEWEERNREEKLHVYFGLCLAITAGILAHPLRWGIDYFIALLF